MMMKIWITIFLLLSKTIGFAQNSIPTFKAKKHKCALFSINNVQITDYIYDCGYGNFYNGISRVHKNGKYGFINYKGKEVVPCIYDHARNLSEGLIAVSKNNKSGFIDKNGKIRIPFNYSLANSFSEGLAAVEKNGVTGYINKKEEVVIPFKYDWLSQPFSEGFAAVEKNEKFGFIDKNGNQITEIKYFLVEGFKNGIAKVSYDGVTIPGDYCGLPTINGFIDTTGKEIIPAIYDEARIWDKAKLIIVRKGGNMGAYNFKGKLIIPIKYFSIGRIDKETGYIRVEKKTDQGYFDGYVNTNGEEVIPCKYKLNSVFINGFIYGEIINNGVLDSLNNVIIPFSTYDAVSEFKNGISRVRNYTNKYGYINTKGKIIIPIIYDKAPYYFTNKIEELELNGKKYYFDIDGNQITNKETITKGINQPYKTIIKEINIKQIPIEKQFTYAVSVTTFTPYELYINDIVAEKDYDSGSNAVIEINQFLLGNGKHTIKLRLLPRTAKNAIDLEAYNMSHFELVKVIKNNKDKGLLFDEEILKLTLPPMPVASPFVEIEWTVEIKDLPYKLEGWSNSKVFKKEDSLKIKKQVVSYYEELREILNNGDINEWKKRLKKERYEIWTSTYELNSNISNNWKSILKDVKNECRGNMLPLEDYDLHFYANGRILVLERNETKLFQDIEVNIKGWNALIFNDEGSVWSMGTMLHMPLGSDTFEIIR